MLFDTGPGQAVLAELGAALPAYDRTIDLIIISHAHADHLDGLRAILESYTVREIWLPTLPDNELGQATRAALAAHPEITIRYGRAGDWRVLPGGDTLTLWHPDKSDLEDHASTQVVAVDDSSGDRLLLTGDLDAADEADALAYCLSWHNCAAPYTMLQVSHHGSATSTGGAWLETTRPNEAVISVGENDYGHPNEATLNRLRQHGIPYFRTDQAGRVLTRLAQRR